MDDYTPECLQARAMEMLKNPLEPHPEAKHDLASFGYALLLTQSVMDKPEHLDDNINMLNVILEQTYARGFRDGGLQPEDRYNARGRIPRY